MRDLEEIRAEIDVIDRQITELFEQRMNCTREVAEYKIARHMQVLDSRREEEKLRALEAQAHTDENAAGVHTLFETIMKISRQQQQKLLDKNNKS